MTKNKSLEQAENLLHELVKEWKVEYSDFNAREGGRLLAYGALRGRVVSRFHRMAISDVR